MRTKTSCPHKSRAYRFGKGGFVGGYLRQNSSLWRTASHQYAETPHESVVHLFLGDGEIDCLRRLSRIGTREDRARIDTGIDTQTTKSSRRYLVKPTSSDPTIHGLSGALPQSRTPSEHLLRDSHLQHIAGERNASVPVVDTRGTLEHLHDSPAAEHLKDLRQKTRREISEHAKGTSGD